MLTFSKKHQSKLAHRPIFLPHGSFRHGDRLFLEGQVVRLNEKYLDASEGEKIWINVRRMISLYRGKPIKEGTLLFTLNGRQEQIPIDNSMVRASIRLSQEEEISTYACELSDGTTVDIPFDHLERTHIPQFSTGVISDIDDTILISRIQNLIRKVALVFFNNAFRRKAVHQMADLYRRFERQSSPIFYVSNSQLNLYPMLDLFLTINEFPAGPLYLRPFSSVSRTIFGGSTSRVLLHHKKSKIRFVLDSFRDSSFVLVGDSGESDLRIYHEVAATRPQQVRAVFIRHLGNDVVDLEKYRHSFNELNIPFYHESDPGKFPVLD